MTSPQKICCFWSTDGGAVLWTALARVAGGLCTLGTVSVAVIPVVVAQEPSQCGRPPKVALSFRARPCLCPIGAVGLTLCVCMCVHVGVCACVCLYVYVSLWVFIGVGGLVCFIIVVFSLCEALCVAFNV